MTATATETPHTLYTFRRCPYAMRARMALAVAGIPAKVREVVLRDKPAAMLDASPKGTVPVIVTNTGQIIDESLDVMHWALRQDDPEGWLATAPDETKNLIARIDGPFKKALDRYKYANRYEAEDVDPEEQRSKGLMFLDEINAQLSTTDGQLFGPRRSLADIAIFPFVRQFANTDREWFDALPLPNLQKWLAGHLDSDLFSLVMKKYPQWAPGAEEPPLPTLNVVS